MVTLKKKQRFVCIWKAACVQLLFPLLEQYNVELGKAEMGSFEIMKRKGFGTFLFRQ